MKKILLNPWLALLTLFLITLIRFFDPGFVESVRLRYFDTLITGQPRDSVPVNLVNIDEATLEKYGQFPFSRDIYAEIIEELYRRDAGLVVFNILMPDRDRFGKDQQLAKTLKNHQVLLPNLGFTRQRNTDFGSAAQVIGAEPSGRIVEYPAVIANIEPLQELSAGAGVVNTFPEIDGVVRRMPLVILANENVHPTLALEILRVAAGDSKFQVKIGDQGVEAVRVPSVDKFETDNLARIWIDWSKHSREYSLVNLPKTFNKEIVIVGLSAPGLANPIATSRGEVWPHEMQAAVVGTLMTKSNIARPSWADGAEIAAIAVLGIITIFMMRWTYVGIAAFILLVIVGIFGSRYAYTEYRYLLDATAFSVAIILTGLHAYINKFVSEFLQKQQIKKQFSTYLSPDLVAKLIKDPSLLKLGGEEKELSIMFTDVRGFTGISEHYGRDVQGLTKIMNRYMTAMTRKILENNGTLDKYIGDAQMAFWNAPLDETLHCKEAVKAALEMLGELDGFNKEVTSEGVPPFGMGIGINTGVVVVGNMGSDQRFDYTCLGDAVNLASRLEGQSKNYGVKIVLGPVTAERLSDEYFTLELDCIAVKGKTEGVRIYTVFFNPNNSNKVNWNSSREIHNTMLRAYRNQQWSVAIELVEQLKGSFDHQMDEYYGIWLDRIREMSKSNLPKNWDGVHRAQSK